MTDPDLDVFLQTDLGDLCKYIGTNVHTHFPRKRTFIIQYWGDNSKRDDQTDKLCVGSNNCNRFRADYYDENNTNKLKSIEQYVHDNRAIIVNVWNEIKKTNPKTRIKSFLIYFNLKNTSINICLNRLGSWSIPDSRIFNEFKAPS